MLDNINTAIEIVVINGESTPYGFAHQMIGKYQVQVRIWPIPDEAAATQIARIVSKAIAGIDGISIDHQSACGDRTLWGTNNAN